MKIYDLLIKLYNPQLNDSIYIDKNFYGEQLSLLKDTLKQCDEFNECDSLDILSTPVIKDVNNKIWSVETISLTDFIKFKGKCYLYSIGFREDFGSVESWHEQDAPLITPIYYDSKNATPRRKMVIPFISDNSEINNKTELRETFENMLNNPLDFIQKYSIYITIRGLFERIEVNSENVGQSVDRKIDIDINTEQDYFVVYYLSPVVDDQEINLKVKFITLDLKYEDIFKRRFTYTLLNEEELNKFLEENKIEIK